jgi:hypothetical protein
MMMAQELISVRDSLPPPKVVMHHKVTLQVMISWHHTHEQISTTMLGHAHPTLDASMPQGSALFMPAISAACAR